MSKLVGIVISNSTHEIAPFVIIENEHVTVNHYYFMKHPLYEKNVLLSVYSISPYNPEMVPGRIGILVAKKGIRNDSGKYLESHIANAEILGYFDDRKKWRSLEAPPSVGAEIYEPTEQELKEFFQLARDDKDTLFVDIGRVKGTSIPVLLDLNVIAKSHIFVAGMTRAGKSSFIVNLAMRSAKVTPRPHIVIFDRRKEYGSLTKIEGSRLLSYRSFVPLGFKPEVAADRLGLSGKTAEAFIAALAGLNGDEISFPALQQKLREEVEHYIQRDKENVYNRLERIIRNRGRFLFERHEVLDIINEVAQNPTLIMDFSVDSDVEAQHRAAADIIQKITSHAMGLRGQFAVIVCVEEAQYFAPERSFEIASSSAESQVRAKFVEAISQAGGYNVGFVIMTQRPAYVTKSVVSQCNSVACFRLKSGNDQEAILQFTEYGSAKLKDILPGLADHEALMWGLALQTPFPVVAEIGVDEYPQKALVSAKQAWSGMANRNEKNRATVQRSEYEESVALD